MRSVVLCYPNMCVYAQAFVRVCDYFLPGNQLSAMAESSMRLLGPLKLFLFHQWLRWQVALWIWQIPHHKSEDKEKEEKKTKQWIFRVWISGLCICWTNKTSQHAFVIAHPRTTKLLPTSNATLAMLIWWWWWWWCTNPWHHLQEPLWFWWRPKWMWTRMGGEHKKEDRIEMN